MLGKIFVNEIVISQKLEEYIEDIIGFIDCGEDVYIGDSLIINIEQNRRKNIKNVIINLIQTFSQNNSIIHEPNNLKIMFYQNSISPLDLEILINYSVIDLLNIVLYNVRNSQQYYRNVMLKTKGTRYESNLYINRKLGFYGNEIEKLISERKQHIDDLKENQTPSFDFTDTTIISHRKKLKLR